MMEIIFSNKRTLISSEKSRKTETFPGAKVERRRTMCGGNWAREG